MSHELLEDRVGKVELEQARQGAVLERVQQDVKSIGTGVEKLLERDARRPEPTTLKGVAATLATAATAVGSVGFFVWWFVGTSPVIDEIRTVERQLETRVMRLDDPEIGRVTRLEQEKSERFDSIDASLLQLGRGLERIGAGLENLGAKAVPEPSWSAKVGRP